MADCCSMHTPGARLGTALCCDPNDCGPCCSHCPTCPTRAESRAHLQGRVASWHARRFPAAQPYNVALKAMEEMGELAEALNGHLTQDATDKVTARRGEVGAEAADVAICVMVLLGRWFPDRDLLSEVEAKLATLSDPASGHRSALAAGAADA